MFTLAFEIDLTRAVLLDVIGLRVRRLRASPRQPVAAAKALFMWPENNSEAEHRTVLETR